MLHIAQHSQKSANETNDRIREWQELRPYYAPPLLYQAAAVVMLLLLVALLSQL